MTNVPNINGQSAEYLERQLSAFKRALDSSAPTAEGVRNHHFMSRLVHNFSDARLHEIAVYYSKLSCKP